MLFDAPTLIAFMAAAAVLVLLPGPGTAWIVAQSIAGGSRRGAVAALGLETATLAHATAAGLGLSAILATSAFAFEAVKLVGAAYLVWLGIKAWLDARAIDPSLAGATDPRPTEPIGLRPRDVYLRSVLTGIFNPKVALFFLAFLPQFVHPERGLAWLQFLVLGAIVSVLGFGYSLLLAFAVDRLGRRLVANARSARLRQHAIGALFVGLGLRLVFEQRH